MGGEDLVLHQLNPRLTNYKSTLKCVYFSFSPYGLIAFDRKKKSSPRMCILVTLRAIVPAVLSKYSSYTPVHSSLWDSLSSWKVIWTFSRLLSSPASFTHTWSLPPFLYKGWVKAVLISHGIGARTLAGFLAFQPCTFHNFPSHCLWCSL